MNQFRNDKLKWLDNIKKKDPKSLVFVIAVGGDEAPGFGTTFLISFLNVGKRIASSKENFFIFGGNVKENGTFVKKM